MPGVIAEDGVVAAAGGGGAAPGTDPVIEAAMFLGSHCDALNPPEAKGC